MKSTHTKLAVLAGAWLLVAGAAAAPQGSVERGRDLDDIYHFIHSLGPAGEPAPAYLPPGTAAAGPVVRFP